MKKELPEISQNTQENTCEFCEICKNTVFYRTPPVAASKSDEVNLKIRLIF